jgi:5'(3')-deoxyribonucleotidase
MALLRQEAKKHMGETKFVLGVDLDGVVADFYGGMREIAAEWLEVEKDTLPEKVTYGLPEWSLDNAPGGYDALHKFAVTQRQLFLNLKPIQGAAVSLRRLSADHDVRIRVITHRLFIKYFHETAVRQTVEWLDKFDIPYWDLCFMKDKAAVGADLYVEDSPQNVEALRQDGHPTIVFTNSTNLNVAAPRANTWDDVVTLTLQEAQRWKANKKSTKRSAGT